MTYPLSRETDHRLDCHDGAWNPTCAECQGYEAQQQTKMLDAIHSQLERIANTLEAQNKPPFRANIDGRDFQGAMQRAAQDRRTR